MKVLVYSMIFLIFLILLTFFVRRPGRIGLHSIFIARENLPFLKEWILYHRALGVDNFYLYDNTGTQKASGAQNVRKALRLGSVNKYRVNYRKHVPGSDEDIDEKLREICKEFGDSVKLIKWQPRDDDDNIIHGQVEGHHDCLARFGDEVDWMGILDQDEYLYLKQGDLRRYLTRLPRRVSCVQLRQKKFANRFRHLDKNVVQIENSKNRVENGSWKNIFRPSHTERIGVHSWHGKGKMHRPGGEEFRFNHYNANWGPNQTTKVTDMSSNHYAKTVVKKCSNDPNCAPGSLSTS